MAALKQRFNKFEARVRVPASLRPEYGGQELVYRTLAATDRRSAKLEASAWELSLRADWATRQPGGAATAASLRRVYESVRSIAAKGEFGEFEGDTSAYDEHTAAIEHELGKLADRIGDRELTSEEQARVWALNDAKAQRQGQHVPRRSDLEPTFKELAEEHLRLWRTAPGLKDTNTGQQKLAIFDLFALYFGERPIREVRRGDAAAFVDALRQLDPAWARSGKAKSESKALSWAELLKSFGGRPKGLADATVNRHMVTLSALWRWAEEREHCEGRNPFDGHRRKLKEGVNRHGYEAWKTEELALLFSPPPKREDLTEVILVAMFTGMRLNEIVSLTWGQIGRSEGVAYIDVTDSKTVAGLRRVPLHPRLQWLLKRSEGAPSAGRVWPKFTPEGPGSKPGGDAGKQFSAHKAARGLVGRNRVFHSFRKNVVGQLERARVPQNEVAQLVGHEKQGLTFGVYGEAMTLQRLAQIVALIDYPEVPLPEPEAE